MSLSASQSTQLPNVAPESDDDQIDQILAAAEAPTIPFEMAQLVPDVMACLAVIALSIEHHGPGHDLGAPDPGHGLTHVCN